MKACNGIRNRALVVTKFSNCIKQRATKLSQSNKNKKKTAVQRKQMQNLKFIGKIINLTCRCKSLIMCFVNAQPAIFPHLLSPFKTKLFLHFSHDKVYALNS